MEDISINRKECIGCGSCANLCIQGAISLKRDLGPVVIYSHIDVNQDICVACELCEEKMTSMFCMTFSSMSFQSLKSTSTLKV